MRSFWRALLSCLFITTGVLHFSQSQAFVKVMPPYLPFPLILVWVSGLAEIAGGLGVQSRRTRRIAGYSLIALLVAVFPANIHMAVHGTKDMGIDAPHWVWWARLPLQAVLVAWVWVVAIDEKAQ